MLVSYGNEILSCGNEILSHGNEMLSRGNEILTCGNNFYIVVLLLISNRSCLLVVVPIVLGIVTQIVNTLQFPFSIHQSLSQPNILAIVLPLMLRRSEMTSLKMFAVQHQLPPSGRSLKHTCLLKPTHHSLPITSVSPWYDLAMFLD